MDSGWWSTPALIPIRRRTSGICAMQFWAIRFSGCCGRMATSAATRWGAELHRQHGRAGCGRGGGLAYLPQDTFSTVTEQELKTAQGVKKMIDELAVRAKQIQRTVTI